MYNGVMVFGGLYELEGILVSLYFVFFVILGNCIFEIIFFVEKLNN